jgi:predicted  nucleic acid-binding Zn-ribbon protein
MNQAFHLYQLQKVDQQIAKIKVRLQDIDSKLSSDRRIVNAEKQVKEAKIKLDKVNKKLKHLEEQAHQIHVDVQTNEASLYSGKIRNPKELFDLQEKVASDKRRIQKIEDQQLEALMAVEEAENDLSQSEQRLQQTRGVVIQDQADLAGEKQKLLQQMDSLEKERQAKLSLIDDESMKIYRRLYEQKRGVAVAAVEDRACTACGAVLTPAEWQSARSPHQIFFCPSCGRVLYSG